MSAWAAAVRRGCGTRQAGAIYMEVGIGSVGRPLNDFLVDSPMRVDQLPNVKPVGVTFIERDGATHVIDWIGSVHYPNVADFIEEVRRFGLSRRIASRAEFSQLQPGSRILCVHALAWQSPEAQAKHYDVLPEPLDYRVCITDREDHGRGSNGPCLTGVYLDVQDGTPLNPEPDETFTVAGRSLMATAPLSSPPDDGVYLTSRSLPSFTYTAIRNPPLPKDAYRPAIFLSLPISGLTVVEHPDEAMFSDIHARATRSGLEVEVVPE